MDGAAQREGCRASQFEFGLIRVFCAAMLWLGIYILAICLCGAALTLALSRSSVRMCEFLGSSLILGSGAMPLLLLWLSMLGIRPSRISIAIIGLIAIGSIPLIWKFRQFPKLRRFRSDPMNSKDILIFAICIALIGVQLFATFVIAFKLPILEVDGWAIWGLKAKVLFHQPLSPTPDYFSDLSLSFSHLDYPLLVPMLWASGATAMGNFDHPAAKGALALPVLGMVLLLYSTLRDALPRDRAILLTALVGAAPAISRWSGIGLADAALAALVLAAVVYLFRWISGRSPRDAIAVGLLTAIIVQTKLEGSIFAISILAVMFVVAIPSIRRAWPSALIAILSAAIIAAPWLIWSRDLPHVHENYASRLSPSQLFQGLPRIPIIARSILTDPNSWAWGPLLTVLLLSAVIGFRAWKTPQVRAGWTVLLIQFLSYFAAYLITPWEPQGIVSTTASRLILHIAPLAALLTGLHWQIALIERQTIHPKPILPAAQ